MATIHKVNVYISSPLCLLHAFIVGGADGKYKLVNTTDLRPKKLKSGAQYLVQTVHITSSNNVQFNDTVNFVLSSNTSIATVVRVS